MEPPPLFAFRSVQVVDIVRQGLAVVEGLGEGKGEVGLRALVDVIERAVLGEGQAVGAGDAEEAAVGGAHRQDDAASAARGAAQYDLDGIHLDFPMNGAWDDSEALMIAGDFSQLVYSIRQDVTYKVLTEATIVDPTTREVVYSLAQQDMVALRAVMRMGWEIPNPVSAYRSDLQSYSPFAVYVPGD